MFARSNPLQSIGKVVEHVRIGILLDGKRRGRMRDENRQQSVANVLLGEPVSEVPADIFKAGPPRFERQRVACLATNSFHSIPFDVDAPAAPVTRLIALRLRRARSRHTCGVSMIAPNQYAI